MTETMTRSESADDLGPERPRRSVLRGLSGAVTVCAVLLVLLVLAAQVYFQLRGYPVSAGAASVCTPWPHCSP